MNEKSKELEFLIELSEKACEMARSAYIATGVSFDMKNDFTPVTEHDIAINEMIIKETKERFPEWGVIGEERKWNEDAEVAIMVDPIDGTRPFTFGVPVFGFMIALLRGSEAVAGVIANPTVSRTLYAEKGKGAFHLESGNRIAVSKNETLDRSVLSLSSSNVLSSHIRRHMRGLHKANIVSLASASETAAMIALGHVTADFAVHKSPHDVAPVKIIVEEAGGKVTDLEGKEHDFRQEQINGAMISNGAIHEDMFGIFRSAQNDYELDSFDD